MLPVARILKSFGTDGGLLISSLVDFESLDLKEPVFIVFDGLQVPFFIRDYSPKGSKAVIHLNDVLNLDDAEEIVGREIFADVELEEEEDADFSGWTVTDRGRTLGVCTGIEPIPGNLCLYIELKDSKKEILIPLHQDFLLSADPEKRILSLDLPDGLY